MAIANPVRRSTLDAEQVRVWDACLERLPGTDVYHTAAYHQAHEANGDGTPVLFTFEEEGELFLHPIMVRRIPVVSGYGISGMDGGYCDAETVYGYSGPLASTIQPGFMCRAWHAFDLWCQEHRIVASFTRFNPITGNGAHRFADPDSAVVQERETVVLSLMGGEADLWQRYSKTHRNMVRKGQRIGLRVEHGMGHSRSFQRLYTATMARNRAANYYLFGDTYFEALDIGLGNRLKLFVVRAGDRIVASALFLLHADRMHYHLAGSDPDYPGHGDNNLLLHVAALWGQGHGYRWLHLGGGRTNAPDDSLLRFKASISKERLPFYTGRRVHDEAAYERLCGEWMAAHGVTERPDYFLLWRKP